MKAVVLQLGVVTYIFCMPLAPKERRAETSRLAVEHFKRLESDGNGRLSASEAGKAEFFRRADVDEDGFVTLADVQS